MISCIFSLKPIQWNTVETRYTDDWILVGSSPAANPMTQLRHHRPPCFINDINCHWSKSKAQNKPIKNHQHTVKSFALSFLQATCLMLCTLWLYNSFKNPRFYGEFAQKNRPPNNPKPSTRYIPGYTYLLVTSKFCSLCCIYNIHVYIYIYALLYITLLYIALHLIYVYVYILFKLIIPYISQCSPWIWNFPRVPAKGRFPGCTTLGRYTQPDPGTWWHEISRNIMGISSGNIFLLVYTIYIQKLSITTKPYMVLSVNWWDTRIKKKNIISRCCQGVSYKDWVL